MWVCESSVKYYKSMNVGLKQFYAILFNTASQTNFPENKNNVFSRFGVNHRSGTVEDPLKMVVKKTLTCRDFILTNTFLIFYWF